MSYEWLYREPPPAFYPAINKFAAAGMSWHGIEKLLSFDAYDEGGAPLLIAVDHTIKGNFGLTKMAAAFPAEMLAKIAEIEPDPKKLHVVGNALGATETFGSNRNQDSFPRLGLMNSDPHTYGHKTFENAHVFKHHVNKDPEKAIGKVSYAFYDSLLDKVLLLYYILKDKAPHIVDRLEKGESLETSMGCRCPYDVCSICGKKAKDRTEYCEHLKNHPNAVFPDGRKVMAHTPHPRFFDQSHVAKGADPIAKTLEVVDAPAKEAWDRRPRIYDMSPGRTPVFAKTAAPYRSTHSGIPMGDPGAPRRSDAEVDRMLDEPLMKINTEDLKRMRRRYHKDGCPAPEDSGPCTCREKKASMSIPWEACPKEAAHNLSQAIKLHKEHIKMPGTATPKSQVELANLLDAAKAEAKTAAPVFPEQRKDHEGNDRGVPDHVIEIANALRRDNPGMNDESAYRIAWDTHNKNKGGPPQTPIDRHVEHGDPTGIRAKLAGATTLEDFLHKAAKTCTATITKEIPGMATALNPPVPSKPGAATSDVAADLKVASFAEHLLWVLELAEPDLAPSFLDKLASEHGPREVLSTLTAQGIVLKDHEFEYLISKVAERREPTLHDVELDPRCVSRRLCEKIAEDVLDARSGLPQHLYRRSTVLAKCASQMDPRQMMQMLQLLQMMQGRQGPSGNLQPHSSGPYIPPGLQQHLMNEALLQMYRTNLGRADPSAFDRMPAIGLGGIKQGSLMDFVETCRGLPTAAYLKYAYGPRSDFDTPADWLEIEVPAAHFWTQEFVVKPRASLEKVAAVAAGTSSDLLDAATAINLRFVREALLTKRLAEE